MLEGSNSAKIFKYFFCYIIVDLLSKSIPFLSFIPLWGFDASINILSLLVSKKGILRARVVSYEVITGNYSFYAALSKVIIVQNSSWELLMSLVDILCTKGSVKGKLLRVKTSTKFYIFAGLLNLSY